MMALPDQQISKIEFNAALMLRGRAMAPVVVLRQADADPMLLTPALAREYANLLNICAEEAETGAALAAAHPASVTSIFSKGGRA